MELISAPPQIRENLGELISAPPKFGDQKNVVNKRTPNSVIFGSLRGGVYSQLPGSVSPQFHRLILPLISDVRKQGGILNTSLKKT